MKKTSIAPLFTYHADMKNPAIGFLLCYLLTLLPACGPDEKPKHYSPYCLGEAADYVYFKPAFFYPLTITNARYRA